MGTYFPVGNNQRDAATMLYFKDPIPAPTSHSSPILTGNTSIYMNFPPSSEPFSHVHSSCMDALPNSNSSSQEGLLNVGGSWALESQLNAWKEGRNAMLMMHQAGGTSSVLQGGPGQGLSLSLSTHVPLHMSTMTYQNDFSSIMGSNVLMQGEDKGRDISFENEDSFAAGGNGDGATDMSLYGMPSIARAVPNFKYLRAAQELLEEVVNVKKDIKEQKEMRREGEGDSFSAMPKGSGASHIEVSAPEKLELQNKLTKLLTMLDEVDRRYRQYYHQMQIVVSSFDVIAGSGAAKPYTALALQTISRHFRCLRDAINGQIQVVRRSLGEEDASSNERGIGISRLRYVDQQLPQQRALQQLGMMQQHAWRPQRGLPESSVSILRAWLFEHFLHP